MRKATHSELLKKSHATTTKTTSALSLLSSVPSLPSQTHEIIVLLHSQRPYRRKLGPLQTARDLSLQSPYDLIKVETRSDFEQQVSSSSGKEGEGKGTYRLEL